MNLNKLKIWKLLAAAGFIVLMFLAVPASKRISAQVTPLLNFTGKVTSVDGSEVADGNYDFRFRLFQAPSGGSSIWSEEITATSSFSGTIGTSTETASGIQYTYQSGAQASSTIRIGQYLSNGSSSALIIDYNDTSVTVASGSVAWSAGTAINNRPWVEGGVINVNLGAISDISNIDFNQTLYLEVTFNGETMQPRKILTTVPYAFEASSLGGKTGDEFAALADDETITGEWTFNNEVGISTSSDNTALTVTQNGTGDIIEVSSGGSTRFAVQNDGTVQIGDYYFPTAHGTAGYVLKTDAAGNLYWDLDFSGFGGSGLWATSTNMLFMRQVDTGMIVLIGDSATSTFPEPYIFEVDGTSLLDRVSIGEGNELRFYNDDNSYYVSLQASSTLASNLSLVWPIDSGSDGQALVTDGNGELHWSNLPSSALIFEGQEGFFPYYASMGTQLSATSSIFISTMGNIGIGTTSPQYLFTIGTSTDNYFALDEYGDIKHGNWNAGIIGTEYGGTGTSTASWTGLSFINNGVWVATTVLSSVFGGTGLSSYSQGSIIIATSSDVLAELAIGTAGYILQTVNGRPTWVSTTTLGIDFNTIGGALEASKGGTGQDSSTWSGMVHVDGGTWSAISAASGSVAFWATPYRLGYEDALSVSRGGTGTTTAPEFGKLLIGGHGNYYNFIATSSLYIDIGDTTGVLTYDRGGTGLSSYNQGSIIIATSTDSLAELAIGTAGYILQTVNGRPTWVSTTTLGIDFNTIGGALEASKGGTGQDSSAWSGMVHVDGGTWSAISAASGSVAFWATPYRLGYEDALSVSRGGTGTTTSGWTGFLYVRNGSWESTSTISVAYGGTGLTSLAEGNFIVGLNNNTMQATSSIYLKPSGEFGIGTTTPSNLLTVGSNIGQQFLVSATGTILDGVWNAGIISPYYGGTGSSTANWTGFTYINNGTWSSTSTIPVVFGGTGLTDVGEGFTIIGFNNSHLNATNTLYVSPEQLVGIGTTSPLNKLSIVGGVGVHDRNDLKLYEYASNGLEYVGFRSPNTLAASQIYVLPSTDGTAGQALLTDANGNLSWGDPSGSGSVASGTPGYIAYFNDYTQSARATSSIFIAPSGNFGVGTTTPINKLDVYGNIGVRNQNEFRLYELVGNGEEYVGFRSPSLLSATQVYALPSADGTAGQALLTDSNGNLYWDDPSGSGSVASGTPGYIAYFNDYTNSARATSSIYLAPSGKFGIGTTSPAYLLSVGSILGQQFLVSATGTVYDGYWSAEIIDIAYGGTGANTATSARENLDLDEVYKFGINATGTNGQVWMSDGDGRGRWVDASQVSGSKLKFIGTTTATTDGDIASSTYQGYEAANFMCDYEYPGSVFCHVYNIMTTIQEDDISDWSGDNAWVSEGPPGYTEQANDCNGWTNNAVTAFGAFWEFDTNGGMGWLVNCTETKPLSCCSYQ